MPHSNKFEHRLSSCDPFVLYQHFDPNNSIKIVNVAHNLKQIFKFLSLTFDFKDVTLTLERLSKPVLSF